MNNYSNAYTEVYTILSYLEEEELNKIPKETLGVIYNNRNLDYKYEVNEELSLEEQEMLPETKALLCMLFKNYLSKEEQNEETKEKQEEIKEIEKENENLEEKITETIKNDVEEINNAQDLHPVVKPKESIFKKIINFIKKLFKTKTIAKKD